MNNKILFLIFLVSIPIVAQQQNDVVPTMAAEGFMFGDNESYPSVVKDFEHSFEVLEKLPCDIVIATHPAATEFWQQLEVRERGEKDALTDQTACSRCAAAARSRLENGLIMKKIPRSDLFCVD